MVTPKAPQRIDRPEQVGTAATVTVAQSSIALAIERSCLLLLPLLWSVSLPRIGWVQLIYGERNALKSEPQSWAR
jgi:hypothetical protein